VPDAELEKVVSGSTERLKGIAKVKPEYFKRYLRRAVGKSAVETVDKPAEESVEEKKVEGNASEPPAPAEQGKKRKSSLKSFKDRKKAKRLEKKKDRGYMEKPAWDNLCVPFVTLGKTCNWDNCKFSHDIVKYVAAKEAASTYLGDKCAFFEKFGVCRDSIRCMFAGAHIKKVVSEDGTVTAIENIDNRANGKYPDFEQEVTNQITPELTKLLRRHKYRFDDVQVPLRSVERKKRGPFSFKNKIYIAPLTTVGNLPFRRVVKEFGADITCGEMALSKSLVDGYAGEWALLKRHKSEDIFGVQVCGSKPQLLAKAAALIERETDVDFIDLNVGCPIDLVTDQGAGSALLNRVAKLEQIIQEMTTITKGRIPVGIKVRSGWAKSRPTTHMLATEVQTWKHSMEYGDAIAYLSIHGRSRQARYTNYANWDYIHKCNNRLIASEQVYRKTQSTAPPLSPVPVFGNGDIFAFTDWERHLNRVEEWKQEIAEVEAECLNEDSRMFKCINKQARRTGENEQLDKNLEELEARLTTCMIGRGALIKPWISTEIKERRHWDISGSERMDIVKNFVDYGLEHWGSDSVGVTRTRQFLLEWLSFTCRYVPVGILDEMYIPQMMNDRPPQIIGRDDRETILSSHNVADWVKISEMFLGPVPDGFRFEAKHKSNSYEFETDRLVKEGLTDCL